MPVPAEPERETSADNPYEIFKENPNVPVKDFKYIQDLLLVRRAEAPTRDAMSNKVRFIVDRDYTALWSEEEVTDHAEEQTRWHKVVVPRGYYTDFASVPKIFRGIVSRIGPWVEASVVHDYLCDAWKWDDNEEWDFARRRWADRLMVVAMRKAGIRWRLHLICAAITFFAYYQLLQNTFGLAPQFSRDKSDYFDLELMDQDPREGGPS